METQELIELFKQRGLERVNAGNKYQREMNEFLTEFIDDSGYEELMPDGFVLEADNSIVGNDSYGSEDSYLEIIVKHVETGRYLSVYGTRQNYYGTDFDGIKEVKPKQVVKTIFE